jgi:hypothetical protein
MTRILLAAVAVALAGCATLDPDAGYTNETCRRAMYADPEVQTLTSTMLATGGFLVAKHLDERKADAYRRCMQSTGQAPPGGVERIRKD